MVVEERDDGRIGCDRSIQRDELALDGYARSGAFGPLDREIEAADVAAVVAGLRDGDGSLSVGAGDHLWNVDFGVAVSAHDEVYAGHGRGQRSVGFDAEVAQHHDHVGLLAQDWARSGAPLRRGRGRSMERSPDAPCE